MPDSFNFVTETGWIVWSLWGVFVCLFVKSDPVFACEDINTEFSDQGLTIYTCLTWNSRSVHLWNAGIKAYVTIS